MKVLAPPDDCGRGDANKRSEVKVARQRIWPGNLTAAWAVGRAEGRLGS